MYRNTYQAGFLSILYSIGSKPLQIWDKKGACEAGAGGTETRGGAAHGRGAPATGSLARPHLTPPLRPAVKNGHIKRITDQDIQSSVLEICGANVSTTYVSAPADPKKTLGIKLPFLVMIIKNLKKYFTFEVMVLDDKGIHRRFRASNYQVRSRSRRVAAGEGLTRGV